MNCRVVVPVLAVLVTAGAAFAQQMSATLPVTPGAEAPSILPLQRRASLPMPALLQTRAHEIFTGSCAACHGVTLDAGPAAASLFRRTFLEANSDAQIVEKIGKGGVASQKPHAYDTSFSPEEITQLAAYLRIRGGILNRTVGIASQIDGKIFKTQKANFQVDVLARGLNQPWGLVWLPDGRILFTQRSGALSTLDRNGLVSAVTGTPKVFARQDGGLLDVGLPPDHAKTGWVFLAYSTVLPEHVLEPGDYRMTDLPPLSMTKIVRGKINAKNEWVGQETLFEAPREIYNHYTGHYGARFLFDGKGHLFWTMGDRQDALASQNLASPLGKIHRINEDGSIPKDNPFLRTPGALPSIWSLGHRHPEGIAFDPRTGLLWETEHGPVGGDEINIIEAGRNYGWGMATMGLEPGIARQRAVGTTDPIAWYNPSIGPGSVNFYTGDSFPGWKNSMFVPGMVGQTLLRIEIADKKILSQEAVLKDIGRLREVKTGPDGNIYVLAQTQNGDAKGGSIIRLRPVK